MPGVAVVARRSPRTPSPAREYDVVVRAVSLLENFRRIKCQLLACLSLFPSRRVCLKAHRPREDAASNQDTGNDGEAADVASDPTKGKDYGALQVYVQSKCPICPAIARGSGLSRED